MRILQIHAKKFYYKATEKALQIAENVGESSKEIEDVLVAFSSIEVGDDQDLAREAARGICDHASRVKASAIVIYPYAHLSSSLESPEKSLEILKVLESETKACYERVIRAPFGWYKEFSLEAYGHPLAELSRGYERDREEAIIRLSRSMHDKLLTDYLPRFGLKPNKHALVIDEPWSLLLHQNGLFKASYCFSEDLRKALSACPNGGSFLLTIRPGGEKLLELALPDFSLPKGEEYSVMKLEKRGDLLYAEHGVDASFPIKAFSGKSEYLFLNSFIISLVVDRLLALEDKGKIYPELPISISPYQAVLLKVGNVSASYIERIAKGVSEAGLSRVFIDQSSAKLGEKLRQWGMRWTPFIIIVGEKEEQSGTVILRIRKTGLQMPLKVENIGEELRSIIGEGR